MDPTGLLRQEKNGSIFGSMKQRHDDPQFKFRIPLEMKERLEAAAKENGRTLTAEILQRLTWTLEGGSSGFDLQSPNFVFGLIRGDVENVPEEGVTIKVNLEEADLVAMYRTMSFEAKKAVYSLSDVVADKTATINDKMTDEIDTWGEAHDLTRAEAIRRLIARGLEADK